MAAGRRRAGHARGRAARCSTPGATRSASRQANVAEYTALLNGLARARELGVTELEVVSDSELMVKQMRGEYKVKNAALIDLSLEASRRARAIGRVTYTAVRREHNVLADRLVNQALDGTGG
ncbi:MAG: ribonuclease HI family protein [Thermoleophilia bacterium]